MVNPRTLRLLVAALAATQCLLIVGIGLVVWHTLGIRSGNSVAATETGTPQTSLASHTEMASDLRPLDWYSPIWKRDLRQPPIPPVVKKKEEPKPTPEPRPALPTLLGTFVEETSSWAYWATGDSKRVVSSVDETIDRFAVVDIQPGRAQLRFRDSSYWVEVERPEPLIARGR